MKKPWRRFALVLVMTAIFVAGITWFYRATQVPTKHSCIANLVGIDSVKDVWALDHKKGLPDDSQSHPIDG